MHDVFVSFTRTGHPELACTIKKLLEKSGISVFMDTEVPPGDGISARIIEALNESRLMVVVYSGAYNQRWACQWELIRAYLAGAAEGSATARILVVNPEPGDDHILPAAIADMRYLRPDELGVLAQSVARKLSQVPAPMGAIGQPTPARWLSPDIAGAFGFTGRFPDLWALHNALSSVDRPLTEASYSAPVTVVTGMPGIGKTLLARAYGWLYGAAYPGGVFHIDLGGSESVSAAHDRFADRVRAIVSSQGIITAGQTAEQVIGLIADKLFATGQATLWIIDDIPADLDSMALARFVIPAPSVRTVFTAPSCAGGVHEIRLGGLGEFDGLSVLRAGRPIGPDDLAAARSIVSRLGGHPQALTATAGYLRDHQGLVSYHGYDASLAQAGPDPDILAVIGRALGEVTPAVRTVIALGALLSASAIPTALIGAILAGGDGISCPEQAASAVIRRLCHGGFARTESSALHIHPLVIQAADSLGPPQLTLTEIAAIAAEKLTGLVARHPDDQALVGTAGILVDCAELDAKSALPLCRLVAGYCERTGDLAQAAAFRHRVAESELRTDEDAVAAALACVANTEFERGISHARHALDAGLAGDLELQARWALAAGLDGLARFAEADDLWTSLARANWTPTSAQRIAFDVARARAMLARGRLAEAKSILDSVLTIPQPVSVPADADQVNAARIEMARLLVWTTKRREGMKLAGSVARYYQDRGSPGHAQCIAAELLWAEAALALEPFELRPDRSKWAEARKLLDRLAEIFPLETGEQSFHGSAVSVQRGLVLMWLGKSRECLKTLLPALPALQQRLGAGHPLVLRAEYAVAMAHCQLGNWGNGADLLGEVWPAQRQLIGPIHPETLQSQVQYGIALWYANRGDDKRSIEILDEACRIIPKEVGRMSDLSQQARIARFLLRRTPHWFAAVVQAMNRPQESWER